MKSQIDLYIISGFLGSGKTSFLKKFMNHFSDKHIGILINELGELSVDSMRVQKDGVNLVELTNGSIYCACLKDSFIQSLVALSKKDIDVLLIENSGMADPSNIHRILTDLESFIPIPYTYKGNICIINVNSFLEHIKILTCIKQQIKTSNYILLNKCDLVTDETLCEIHKKIHTINPQVTAFETTYGNYDESDLFEHLSDNGYDNETTNRCYDKPATISFTWKDTIPLEQLVLFLDMIEDECYRIKGFAVTSDGIYQIDITETEREIKQLESECYSDSYLVLISKKNILPKQQIKDLWNQLIHCNYYEYHHS